MRALLPLIGKDERVVVGLMSGTSLDGIDAAVVRIRGCGASASVELLEYVCIPFDDELRERVKALCTEDSTSSAHICSMNVVLGERFTEAALAAIGKAGFGVADIDLISSHGQTIWHIPADDSEDSRLVRSTLQIGDLSVIAKRTGIVTVGDFRPADMAVGGQGAPLVPYGDLILYGHSAVGRILQNIGGIGNCTVLKAGAAAADVLAFDTGPGNMIMDQFVLTLSGGKDAYDAGGRWAAEGTVCESLVSEWMSHPYFRRTPPKSTGRELFGAGYARQTLEKARSLGLSDADCMATATAFTAASIAESYRSFVFPSYEVSEIIVTGGGAHNRTLLGMLRSMLPSCTVRTSSELGIHDDAKEAVIFALLGNDFVSGVPNNLPSATGAGRATIMGKLALP